jgi:hypothetical protein
LRRFHCRLSLALAEIRGAAERRILRQFRPVACLPTSVRTNDPFFKPRILSDTSRLSIDAMRKDHSITSSAIESSPDGTSMLSARAVCIITSSNLVDCSTGRPTCPERGDVELGDASREPSGEATERQRSNPHGQKSAVHQLLRRVEMTDHMGCDTVGSPADMPLMEC